MKLGRRSQTDIYLVYIDDIVDKNILNELKQRLSKIDIDAIIDGGMIEQLIEDDVFCFFPQYSTQKGLTQQLLQSMKVEL